MTQNNSQIINIRNIEVLLNAIREVLESPAHLPKLITFSGPSGYGKSFAAAFSTNRFNAAYVEIGASWNVTHFLDNVLKELGVATAEKTIAKKVEVVVDALIRSNRPLILDEFDYFTKPRSLEIVREIHDKANVPVILIGEELLPKKLEATERFHNRVLNWVKAEPVNVEDAKKLAKLYTPKLDIKDDLLGHLVKISQGRVRRVCVNLDLIKREAILKDWKEVDLKKWGNGKLYMGTAPSPRKI